MDYELELLSSITGRMLLSMPSLRYLPFLSKTFKLLDKNLEKVFKYINRIVNSRIAIRKFKKSKEVEEPEDLLDCFLNEAYEAENSNWSNEKKENFT